MQRQLAPESRRTEESQKVLLDVERGKQMFPGMQDFVDDGKAGLDSTYLTNVQLAGRLALRKRLLHVLHILRITRHVCQLKQVPDRSGTFHPATCLHPSHVSCNCKPFWHRGHGLQTHLVGKAMLQVAPPASYCLPASPHPGDVSHCYPMAWPVAPLSLAETVQTGFASL